MLGCTLASSTVQIVLRRAYVERYQREAEQPIRGVCVQAMSVHQNYCQLAATGDQPIIEFNLQNSSSCCHQEPFIGSPFYDNMNN